MGQCERETWQVKTEGGKRLPRKKCFPSLILF
jgi:hypothetical protein